MRKSILYLLSLISLSTLFYSCTDENIVTEKVTPISSDWNRDDKLSFEFQIEDTTSLYDLSCIVRNSHEYNFCNLYLKFNILDDSNKVVLSNFQELLLYNPQSGNPLGKEQTLSDIQEGSYLLIKKMKFPRSGNYRILINHQMRDHQELSGLESIGIQVLKNN